MDKQRTALYRHFSVDGILLYIGISNRLPRRIKEHSRFSEWFQEVCDIKIEWLESRERAFIAEREAIKSEKPKWNIIHNKVEDAFDVVEDKVSDGLFIPKYKNAYSRKPMLGILQTVIEAEVFTGIKQSILCLLIETGALPSILLNKRYSEKWQRWYYDRLVSMWDLSTLIESVSESETALYDLIQEAYELKIKYPFKTNNNNEPI